jgi:hypothetical protein
MTGIYLLFVAFIWMAVVIWLSKISTRNFPMETWRVPVAIVIFAVLFPLPLIDEIVGGRQFEQLCKENSKIRVNKAMAAGRTVYLAEVPFVEVKGTWVRVVLRPWRYLDATTNEPVISYNILMADGGWLVRSMGISSGGVPLTFKGSCEPGGVVDPVKLRSELQVIQIQRLN